MRKNKKKSDRIYSRKRKYIIEVNKTKRNKRDLSVKWRNKAWESEKQICITNWKYKYIFLRFYIYSVYCLRWCKKELRVAVRHTVYQNKSDNYCRDMKINGKERRAVNTW